MPDVCSSAVGRFRVMAVPPAAMLARLNADLSNIVPESVKTERTFLNLSPENRTSLFCSCRAGAVQPLPFSYRSRFPRLGRATAKIVAITCIPAALAKTLPLTRTQQKAEGKGGPGIAVTHHRFYDLTRRKATPISMPAKGRSVSEIAPEKAWLTFSGYQSLIELPA